MAPEAQQQHPLSSISNPLATIDQLASTSSSQLDGVPPSLESSLRLAGAELTQAAGILLRLPQEIIAQAIVIFYRFYVGSEGGSFRINAVKDVSAASLYMTAKISFLPQSTRSVLNVYAYLLSPTSPLRRRRRRRRHPSADPRTRTAEKEEEEQEEEKPPDSESYYLPDSTYHAARSTLLHTESLILRSLSFATHFTPPHAIALTYLQTLGVLLPPSSSSSNNIINDDDDGPTTEDKKNPGGAVAARTLAHLNTALFSPQLLYLTHQPPALAVAAIYLAAREVGVKLPAVAWWEVFDVDRETLGFLVVGLGSCEGWVRGEREAWARRGRGCPLTVEELEGEMKRREGEGEGEDG